MSYQKLLIVGNTVKEPSVTESKAEKMAYADFSVAVNRRGEGADFFNVRCFGKLVDSAKKLQKGTQVLVEGRVEIRSYKLEDSEESRKSIRVLADTMRILSHPASSG